MRLAPLRDTHTFRGPVGEEDNAGIVKVLCLYHVISLKVTFITFWREGTFCAYHGACLFSLNQFVKIIITCSTCFFIGLYFRLVD